MINFLNPLKSDFKLFEFWQRLKVQRLDDVVIDELEVWILQEMIDVRDIARNKVIDANDMRVFDETIAEMRTDKPGAAGDKDILSFKNWFVWHGSPSITVGTRFITPLFVSPSKTATVRDEM